MDVTYWHPKQYEASQGTPPPGRACLTDELKAFVSQLAREIPLQWIHMENMPLKDPANDDPRGSITCVPEAIRGWNFDKNEPLRPWHFNDPKWRKLMALRAANVPAAIIDQTLDVIPTAEDHKDCQKNGPCRYRTAASATKSGQTSSFTSSTATDSTTGSASTDKVAPPQYGSEASQEQNKVTVNKYKEGPFVANGLQQKMLAAMPTFDGAEPGEMEIDIFMSKLNHYFAAFPQDFQPPNAKWRAIDTDSRDVQYRRMLFALAATKGEAYRSLDALVQAFLRKEKTYDEVIHSFHATYKAAHTPRTATNKEPALVLAHKFDLEVYNRLFHGFENAVQGFGAVSEMADEALVVRLYKVGLPSSLLDKIDKRDFAKDSLRAWQKAATEVQEEEKTASTSCGDSAGWTHLANDASNASGPSTAGGRSEA